MESQKVLSQSSYTSLQGFQQLSSGTGKVFQHIAVGAVTELTANEFRVILTPTLAREFVLNGHSVYIQSGFALKSGFTDDMYQKAGVTVLKTAEDVYRKCSIILKVQQPLPQEFGYLQPQQVIFCFLNTFCGNSWTQFVQAMIERKVTIMSYNGLRSVGDSFPVFNALSEVSGYLGVQQAMKLMESGAVHGWSTYMGRVFGQIGGLPNTRVLILGATACGMRAALFAAGTGAEVYVMDTSADLLNRLSLHRFHNIQTVQYNQASIEMLLPTVNVLIGCAMNNWTQAPSLVTKTQLQMLPKGAVVIDLAAPMGGNFPTTTLGKTIQDCVSVVDGVIYYTASDITCLTPNTTSLALSQAAMPFVLQVANKGWKRAVIECVGLQSSVVIADSYMTCQPLSIFTSSIRYTPIEQVIQGEIQHFTSSQVDKSLISLKQQLTSFRSQQGVTNYYTIEA